MTKNRKPPLVLVANNPFGHHLLTSQLLDVYRKLELDEEIILFCNGFVNNADPNTQSDFDVRSFASRFGAAFSWTKLIWLLLILRFQEPRARFHLRGFVSAALFAVSRLFLMPSGRYIYDPRGAFFLEWREAGRAKLAGKVFGWIEARLIAHSIATIVTTDRFARLYSRLFGHRQRYQTIYNATSFSFQDIDKPVHAADVVRIVYLGTFNHWQDMDEVARVVASAARQLGPSRTEIYIYTSKKFHARVKETLGRIECKALCVEYVNYRDIPATLADKHIGISVVRPTLSTRIASPIKIGDYVASSLLPLLNSGIGDFDSHYATERSAVLYRFGGEVDLSGIASVQARPNRKIYDCLSIEQASRKLGPLVKQLHNA